MLGKAVTIRTLACVIDTRHSGSFHHQARVGNPSLASNSNCRNYTSRHDHRLCLLFLGRRCRQSLVTKGPQDKPKSQIKTRRSAARASTAPDTRHGCRTLPNSIQNWFYTTYYIPGIEKMTGNYVFWGIRSGNYIFYDFPGLVVLIFFPTVKSPFPQSPSILELICRDQSQCTIHYSLTVIQAGCLLLVKVFNLWSFK